MRTHPSRRDVLRAAPAVAVGMAVAGRAADPPPAGMTVRMSEPRNLEPAFHELIESWITPTERFYVRSHFAMPKIDLAKYRLTVEGLVENRLELTLDDMRAMPSVTSPLTLECAGNGRVFLTPAARGLQWGFGAVGNAEWTGVPLAALLDRAKVKPGASEVVLVGADTGQLTADPPTPGPIPYDRGIPLEKARKSEVLLAWAMNNQPLTPSHGAPLRAVIGGWYGMAAVKWLTRIVVTDRPHQGYWQTIDYSYFERTAGLPTLTPVAAVQPKASVARPAVGEVIPAGKPYTVRGVAWSGEAVVEKVEVSVDGGTNWAVAKLLGEPKPFCWRLWEYAWTVPEKPGPVAVLARATDSRGVTQPAKRDPDRRTYMINHLVPVDVTVR